MCSSLSSPDGSYTEEQNSETQIKAPSTEFDDEFDEEDPLPIIGTCKVLYPFEGNACDGPRLKDDLSYAVREVLASLWLALIASIK